MASSSAALGSIVVECGLQLALIAPLAALCLWRRDRPIARALAFAACFVGAAIALRLPRLVPALDVLGGAWNWDGKLYGVAFGLAAYAATRRLYLDHDYLRLAQRRAWAALVVAAALVAIAAAVAAWFAPPMAFDGETLAYQATMPGLDEEVLYRCVLLGLVQRDRIASGKVRLGESGALVVACLFGLVHALRVGGGEVSLDVGYFAMTLATGYALSWMATRTGSIALPIAAHNFANTVGNLVAMVR